MSNEALAKMIDDIANKNFNKANDAFGEVLGSKIQDVLDQARTKIAGQIFDPEVAIEPDEELVAGEVSVSDLDAEAEAAADEVEAEVDEVEEFDLDDEELDDDGTDDESGDDEDSDSEESEETPDDDNR